MPSDKVREISGNGYTAEIPENFKSKAGKIAGAIESKKFDNGPVDCFVQFDVFDASKQNDLDKIVETNKAAYKATSSTSTTIGGQKAAVISYAPGKDVNAKVNFVVKGNKMYRITTSWYAPDKDYYLPAFEKTIKSMQLL